MEKKSILKKKTMYRVSFLWFLCFLTIYFCLLVASLLNGVLENCPAFTEMRGVNPVVEVVWVLIG